MGAVQSTEWNYEQDLLSDTDSPQSVELDVDESYPKNCGKPRRALGFKEKLNDTPHPEEGGGYHTIYECFQRSVKKFPSRPFYGTRIYELDDEKKVKIASDKQPLRGGYIWESYAEIDNKVRDLGVGLTL